MRNLSGDNLNRSLNYPYKQGTCFRKLDQRKGLNLLFQNQTVLRSWGDAAVVDFLVCPHGGVQLLSLPRFL